MSEKVGNVFGSARAENDALLGATFVETAEFKNLAFTNDFHVAVGRRGTGKSAVFMKLQETFRDSKTILIESTAEEHSTLTLTGTLQAVSPRYDHARAVSKLLWKSAILTHIAAEIVLNRNAHLGRNCEWVRAHVAPLRISNRPSLYGTAAAILKTGDKSSFQALISSIAANTKISELQKFVAEWLVAEKKKAVVLLDRLDEGWAAEPTATGVLGGLTVAAVELAEVFCPIHVLAFVRDNMFRALAHHDPDFSRNIEDASLRLRWTEESLFVLITSRIRVALQIEEQNDVRVWDRLAQNDLKGRSGFRDVLKHTLYRPRDLLNLLNHAYQNARSANREHIIHADIDEAALTISRTRLDDLIKEYEQVLPGTAQFTQAFRGAHSPMLYAQAMALLDDSAADDATDASHSMAVLGSTDDIFVALQGIGFLGFQTERGDYDFCHDGTQGAKLHLKAIDRVAVHPCYARALGIADTEFPIEVAATMNDEEEAVGAKDRIQDQRIRQLGKALVDYEQIQPGPEHAGQFESWVTRAVKVLFGGPLINIELHPNKASALRRDIVGTNAASKGFWKRLRDPYPSRQIVFEAKNYSDLGPEEFNQAVIYGGAAYGKASFIVHRGTAGLDENERAHIKARYYGQEHLIVILPATLLIQCLRKQRSHRRVDYTEEALGKLLDTYERQYLGEKSGRKQRKRR